VRFFISRLVSISMLSPPCPFTRLPSFDVWVIPESGRFRWQFARSPQFADDFGNTHGQSLVGCCQTRRSHHFHAAANRSVGQASELDDVDLAVKSGETRHAAAGVDNQVSGGTSMASAVAGNTNLSSGVMFGTICTGTMWMR
jgi:hypothetical protein